MIEACLNSRPITPLSNDPTDLSALTPGHFLIGETLMSPPQHDVTDVPTTRLSRYQVLEKLRQHFWTRWSKEYLHQLQQRGKWHKTRQPPPLGHLVLLREDNLPPQHYGKNFRISSRCGWNHESCVCENGARCCKTCVGQSVSVANRRLK
jgi:hypothetical protein